MLLSEYLEENPPGVRKGLQVLIEKEYYKTHAFIENKEVELTIISETKNKYLVEYNGWDLLIIFGLHITLDEAYAIIRENNRDMRSI